MNNRLRVCINLDPATDGIVYEKEKGRELDEMYGKTGLVVGTNGHCKMVNKSECCDIMNRISRANMGYWDMDGYLYMYDKRKVHKFEDGEYFIGSMLVIKKGEGKSAFGAFEDEDMFEVLAELQGRVVELGKDNIYYSAFEL